MIDNLFVLAIVDVTTTIIMCGIAIYLGLLICAKVEQMREKHDRNKGK